MRRTVLLAAEAESDLDGILRYIAAESPRAAVKLIDRLLDAVQGLAASAGHYPIILVHRDRQLRRRVVASYNLLFEVTANRVVVLRIVHGSRDLSRLFPED